MKLTTLVNPGGIRWAHRMLDHMRSHGQGGHVLCKCRNSRGLGLIFQSEFNIDALHVHGKMVQMHCQNF